MESKYLQQSQGPPRSKSTPDTPSQPMGTHLGSASAPNPTTPEEKVDTPKTP